MNIFLDHLGQQTGEKSEYYGWYGKYPIIYRVSYIPGGAGFLPSTVWIWNPYIENEQSRINKKLGYSDIHSNQKYINSLDT